MGVEQSNQAAVGLFTEVSDRALDLAIKDVDAAIVIPSDRATASVERIIARSIGVSEPNSTATRRIFAAVSLSTLSHLPPISGFERPKARKVAAPAPLSMGLCEARRLPASEHVLAAVQMDGLPVDEATCGAEIDARIGDIVHMADSAHRIAFLVASTFLPGY